MADKKKQVVREVSLADIRAAVVEYVATEGCGCCGDYAGHKKARDRLGRLLGFHQYADGSGYDFNRVTRPTKKRRPRYDS